MASMLWEKSAQFDLRRSQILCPSDPTVEGLRGMSHYAVRRRKGAAQGIPPRLAPVLRGTVDGIQQHPLEGASALEPQQSPTLLAI